VLHSKYEIVTHNMDNTPHHLMTAIEAEDLFGVKYFYRQRIYRMAESNKITPFQLRGQTCYLGSHILTAFLKDLEQRISSKYPQIDINALRIFYDVATGKRIVIDGLYGRWITINTDKETEEDLLQKIGNIIEFMQEDNKPEVLDVNKNEEAENNDNKQSLAKVLPEDISWIRVDTGTIEGVEIKSYILISLPSVAQFVGIRTDKLIEWVSKTTFAKYVLSAHSKHFHDPQISVPWKKGVVKGFIPLIPFELLPEIIVTFRQSGRTVEYPAKADLLYNIARSTLEAVGLAISGDKEKAAEELARVGRGLGINVADQIIAIFKQYESRDYQVQTNKEFNSKVKEIGGDYAVVTGQMTVGITSRTAGMWKAFGSSRHLPCKLVKSSRDVMRTLSPADGVGMTFGERHFIKDPNVNEAIQTGKQGKDFYQRLKNVGLLDDKS